MILCYSYLNCLSQQGSALIQIKFVNDHSGSVSG